MADAYYARLLHKGLHALELTSTSTFLTYMKSNTGVDCFPFLGQFVMISPKVAGLVNLDKGYM